MSRRGRLVAAVGVALVAALMAGCAESQQAPQPVEVGAGGSPAGGGQTPAPEAARRKVDPRQGGFEIGFGEFAVTLEAPAIRPGPVTFVIRNGGKLVHGFEMESESEDGDSSGPGSGGDDGFKIEQPTFAPGETIRVDLDLAAGVYKIECFVANHDDLGMEILLDVRADAPKVPQEAAGSGSAVSIRGFAFDPSTIQVAAGTEVVWTNRDPTEHTVTADDGSFDSGPVAANGTFSVKLDRSGSVTYTCVIHPTMKGSVQVG